MGALVELRLPMICSFGTGDKALVVKCVAEKIICGMRKDAATRWIDEELLSGLKGPICK